MALILTSLVVVCAVAAVVSVLTRRPGKKALSNEAAFTKALYGR